MRAISFFSLSKENKNFINNKLKKSFLPVSGSLVLISILHKSKLGKGLAYRIIEFLQLFSSSSSPGAPPKPRDSNNATPPSQPNTGPSSFNGLQTPEKKNKNQRMSYMPTPKA